MDAHAAERVRATAAPTPGSPPQRSAKGKPRAFRLFRGMILACIALASAAGLFGSLSAWEGSGRVECPSYPSCLVNQSHLVAGLHLGLGLALGLAVLGVLAGTVFYRRWAPELMGSALAATVLVLVMGTVGATVATGGLSRTLAPVQFVFLAVLVTVLGWLFVRASKVQFPAGCSANSRWDRASPP